MSKRTAARELTHENWEAEEEREEMGTFQRASDEQLANRSIKKAKRRGTNGDSDSPSVFKGLSVFSSFKSTTASSPPAFSFLNGATKANPDKIASTEVNSTTQSVATMDKMNQPLKQTQGSFFGVKAADKANNFSEAKDESGGEAKKDSLFLSNLKALNDGVVVWIQKHLEKNPHVNLTPVFDDYKKHFSELVKKYPPESTSPKESDVGGTTNGSRKDKENTPVGLDKPKDTTATAKPFAFGLQSASAEKSSSEGGKSIFTFGSNSSSVPDKKDSPPSTASTFSFSGFGTDAGKSKGLVFGSSSNGSNSSSSTGTMFGGFNSLPAAKPSSGGFSFSSGSSVTAAAAETKESGGKAEEPSDEPPKVEVNEVKEEDALYEKKCKLFYMKDNAYVDRGVGTLYLKEAGDKTQLVVRAYTNLGNILLNIILNSSVPAVRAGKNGVIIVCVPNPPLDTKAENSNEPVKMLIRVKTTEDADTLLAKIEEYKK